MFELIYDESKHENYGVQETLAKACYLQGSSSRNAYEITVMRQHKFVTKILGSRSENKLIKGSLTIKEWFFSTKNCRSIEISKSQVESNIESSQSCLSQSSLYLKQARLDDAELYAVLALQQKPQQRKAYEALAAVLKAKGEHDAEQECYRDIFPDVVAERQFALTNDELRTVSINSSESSRRSLVCNQTKIEREVPIIPFQNYVSSETKTLKSSAVYVDYIQNGTVWFDGHNRVVKDACSDLLAELVIGNTLLIESVTESKTPVKLSGRAVFLSARGPMNYYHWMTDVVPGLCAIQKDGVDLNSIDKFIIYHDLHDFQKDTLKQFGIEESRIHRLAVHGKYIAAEELIVPSFSNRMALGMGRWVPEFLRSVFITDYADSSTSSRKIYITRSAKDVRGITNESELRNLLLQHGFEPVVMENLSLKEQAITMRQAGVVIATHGAGLTNVMFCKAGTSIVELYGEHLSPCYWAISCLCELRYTNIAALNSAEVANNLNDHKTLDGRRKASFSIDIDAVDNCLSSL